tara:strand:- start:280 stop:909 length:630 start_codon:yes stop_codon:yes gene_type:complete
MEQNTIQLDSSEQERIVFNAFFQHPNPPKAEATGSNPVGCASLAACFSIWPIRISRSAASGWSYRWTAHKAGADSASVPIRTILPDRRAFAPAQGFLPLGAAGGSSRYRHDGYHWRRHRRLGGDRMASGGHTLFGYCFWATLRARYPAATIAPFASLAPVYGSGASVILLREPLPMWKLVASGMVIAGLAIGFIDTKKLPGRLSRGQWG